MKPYLLGLLVFASALAGCSRSDGDGGSTVDDLRDNFDGSGSGTGGTGGSGTGTGSGSGSGGGDAGDGGSTVEGDVGSIEVALSATEVSGILPFTVDFAINATVFDADGGAISDLSAFEWGIFAANNTSPIEGSGTGLPANFT